MWGYHAALRLIEFMIVVFAISFMIDVLYIALTRWMLRRASTTRSVLQIVVIILLDCLFAVVLTVGLFYVGVLLIGKFNGGVFSLGIALVAPCLNAIDFMACSVFLLLMLLVFLHRMMWPILERPIYALARYGVIKNKTLLWAMGSALILAPTDVPLWRWLLEKIPH